MTKNTKKRTVSSRKRAQKPITLTVYLAGLSKEKRTALQNLRRNIRAAAPGLTEGIRYGIPAFLHGGKFLLGYGAAANHCAFYPGSIIQELFKKELKNYDLAKGTIRFSPEKPLPKSSVRKLVRLRIAQRSR